MPAVPRAFLKDLVAERERAATEARAVAAALRRAKEQKRSAARPRPKRDGRTQAVADYIAASLPGPGGPEARAEYLRQRDCKRRRSGDAGSASPQPHAAALPARDPEAPGAVPQAAPVAGPPDERTAVAAQRFLRERSLCEWVARLNMDAGLAPTYTHLWRQWRGALPGGPSAAVGAGGHIGGRVERPPRKWILRWRRRWRVRLRAPTMGPRLDRDTLRAKARGNRAPRRPKSGSPGGPA